MKLADIKELPNEFDFISKINTITSGTIYHAFKSKQSYSITIPNESHGHIWTETTKEFNRSLLNGEYEVIAQ